MTSPNPTSELPIQTLTPEERLAFWNNRASLGEWAGSRDVIAKHLEIDAIATFIKDGMKMLDVGCGNGITAIELAHKINVEVHGFDFSSEMVEGAKKLAADAAAQNQLKGSVKFDVSNILQLPPLERVYDYSMTERVLINLPDWESQKQAIYNMTRPLKQGGAYLMSENSFDGLEKLNDLREAVGLSRIVQPSWNRYLYDNEILATEFEDVKLEKVIYQSSTYYFLSRVINAWQAAQEGKEPDYDAPVNQLGLKLPPLMGEIGQGRVWVWRRIS